MRSSKITFGRLASLVMVIGLIPEQAPALAKSWPLPAEVIAFRVRRDQCGHYRGEEAYDAKRAAELERGLSRTCKGTDSKLLTLRRRYVGNATVIAVLAKYESDVE